MPNVRIAWSDLLPGTYAGVPFLGQAMDNEFSRIIAIHEYPHIDGGDCEDLGAGAANSNLRIKFGGTSAPYHLGAKNAFLSVLALPGPQVMVHPSIGVMAACVSGIREHYEADAECVVLDCTFHRHTATPIVLVAGIAAGPPAIPVVQISTDAAESTSWLAGFEALMAKLIQAVALASSIINLLAYGPAAAVELGAAMMESFTDFLAGTAINVVNSVSAIQGAPEQLSQILDATFDDLDARLEREWGLNEGELEAIKNGDAAYDAGQYTDGLSPRPGDPVGVTAKTHASMMAAATWHALAATTMAYYVADELISADANGDMFDHGTIESAVNPAIRRLQRAIYLHEAAFPRQNGGTSDAMRMAAARMREIAESMQSALPAVYEVEVTGEIALRRLMLDRGIDQDLFEQALRWNPTMRNPNRIPTGTIVRLPIRAA